MKRIYLLFIIIFLPSIVFAKINNVAFISQVLPGNWDDTLNCGQTSYYMVSSYINGVNNEDVLDFNEIKKIDDWLYKKYGDPIRNYNGFYTDVNKIDTIAKEKDNIQNSSVSYGKNDFEKLKNELDNGNIAIVAVRVNMDINKKGHFMVLIGYDDKYVYLNDPGKMLGRKRKYLISDFFDAWKTQNYSYVLIKPNIENKKEDIKKDTNKNIIQKDNATLKSSNILLNKTITDDNRILQTVVRDNKDQLQIITVDAEMDNPGEETEDTLEVGEKISNNKFPFLDENNWMHLDDNLIIDYNIPKSVNGDETGNKEPSFDNSIVDIDNSLNDKFDFNNNYIDNSLVINLSWNNNDNLSMDLDAKIGYGDWENIDIVGNISNYDYYIKKNNEKYYFRLRACDNKNCSDYKNIEQEINIETLSDSSYLGEINCDTVLDKNNIYFCSGDCILDENVNLLVENGVKIKMDPGARFTFLGNAFFVGNADNKIYVMPNNDNNKPGDMGFIYFLNNNYVELNNVDIGYGGYVEFPGKVGDMVQVDGVKNLIIKNSYFHDAYLASGSNINIVNSNVDISGSKFSNSLYGFKISNSSGEIISNEFNNNHYNFGLYNVNKDLKVYDNKIFNGINLAIFGQNILADLKDNILENNKFNLISMTSLNIDSGDFTLSKGIYNIYEANIGESASLTINGGTIFKSYTDHGRFKIDGKILINGIQDNPVIFTSFSDDSYGGDSNLDGNTFAPKVGDWGYLEFSNKSYGSVINNAIFKYGGNYDFKGINHGVIYINGGSNIAINNSVFDKGFYRDIEISYGSNIDITNNKILNSNIYGIDIKEGNNIVIKNNEISGNKNAGICYKPNDSILIEDNIFKNNMNDIVETR